MALSSWAETANQSVGSNLTYKIGSSSDSITAQTLREFFPTTDSTAGPNLSKIIRFSLASDHAFMLGQKSWLCFQLKNPSSAEVITLSGPVTNLFTTCKVYASGQLVEDGAYINRQAQMMRSFQSNEAKLFESIYEGTGGDTIGTNAEKTYCVPMAQLSGLFASDKCWPLKLSSLVVELQCAPAAEALNLGGTTVTYEIHQPVICATLATLDPEVMESVMDHVITTHKSIPVVLPKTYFTVRAAVTSQGSLNLAGGPAVTRAGRFRGSVRRS